MVVMDRAGFHGHRLEPEHHAFPGFQNPFSTSRTGSGTASGISTGPPSGQTQSQTVKRRIGIACRRCRRMRSKCDRGDSGEPCKACKEAGYGSEDCVIPTRGEPDSDRLYRHPRVRAKTTSKKDTAKHRRSAHQSRLQALETSIGDEWDDLPPTGELIDAVSRFVWNYFQLGFIPKDQYLDRLSKEPRSLNLFLLLSIISISARLSPALAQRYGSGVKAAEYFTSRAATIASKELYMDPTLERCQGFYLLSIAQQGNGVQNQSHINMGIAIRLATQLQLHREETYQIPNTNPDLVIRAESARRTLWMLHSQDNLHAGPCSPVSLSASDITALLPCDEADFAAGRLPRSRAALEDTPAALRDPSLVSNPSRSLFASLIQIHHFWGIIGRRATTYAQNSSAKDFETETSESMSKLAQWEELLPKHHTWSQESLRRHKAEGLDLAYLSVTMVTRLCNVVVRRPYLDDIINMDHKPAEQRIYLSNISRQLFSNVYALFEQIVAQFTGRTPNESVGAQMTAFCVYSCALFSSYLCKYPRVCSEQEVVGAAPQMFARTRDILLECREVWPLASHWVESLDRISQNPKGMEPVVGGSMADGKDPIPRLLDQPTQLPLDQPSQDVSPPTFPPTVTTSQAILLPQHHEPALPQALQQSSAPFQSLGAFPSQPGQSLSPQEQPQQLPSQESQHLQQLPSQTAMYLPHTQAEPIQNIGVMLEGFDQAGTIQPQVPSYHVTTQPGQVATTSVPTYYPPVVGPRNDGFENELQSYIGEASDWMQSHAGDWMGGMPGMLG